MSKIIAALLTGFLFTGCISSGHSNPPESDLSIAIDVYGTEGVSQGEIQTHARPIIEKAIGDKTPEAWQKARETIRAQWAKSMALHDLELTKIEYFKNGKRSVFVTIDVIEEQDRKERADWYQKRSRRDYTYKGKTIDLWQAHQEHVISLMRAGKISTSTDGPCPVFHCLAEAKDPAILQQLAGISASARLESAELLSLLSHGADEDARSHAVFAVAHWEDANRVLDTILPLLRDEHAVVRQNAMRVLAAMAEKGHDIRVDKATLKNLLNGFRAYERGKALHLLSIKLKKEKNRLKRLAMIEGLHEPIVRNLRLTQPTNTNNAAAVIESALHEERAGP